MFMGEYRHIGKNPVTIDFIDDIYFFSDVTKINIENVKNFLCYFVLNVLMTLIRFKRINS